MTAFYVSIDCTGCEEEILSGPNITFLEHDGLPVVPYDVAAQSRFVCDECGTTTYTGDFDTLCESDI